MMLYQKRMGSFYVEDMCKSVHKKYKETGQQEYLITLCKLMFERGYYKGLEQANKREKEKGGKKYNVEKERSNKA